MGEKWVSLTRQGWDLHFCIAWAEKGGVRMLGQAQYTLGQTQETRPIHTQSPSGAKVPGPRSG